MTRKEFVELFNEDPEELFGPDWEVFISSFEAKKEPLKFKKDEDEQSVL